MAWSTSDIGAWKAAASSDVTSTPGAGSATLAGLVPTIDWTDNKTSSPGAGSAALAGLAPTATTTTSQPVAKEVGAGALVLAGAAPTLELTDFKTVLPAADALVLAGLAPTINTTANWDISVGAGSLTLAGAAPTINTTANWAIPVDAGTITITGYEPAAVNGDNKVIPVAAGALSLDGLAPTILWTDNKTVEPSVGSITFAGLAPLTIVPQSVAPGVVAVVLAGAAPTIAVELPITDVATGTPTQLWEDTSTESTRTTTTVTVDTSVVGRYLIGCVMFRRQTGTVTGVRELSGNWVKIGQSVLGTTCAFAWFYKTAVGGTDDDFKPSMEGGVTGYIVANVSEWSGLVPGAPQDSSVNSPASAVSSVPGSVTPTTDFGLAITAIGIRTVESWCGSGEYTGFPNIEIDSSYTEQWYTNEGAAGTPMLGIGYKLYSDTTAQNPTWSTTQTAGFISSGVAVFPSSVIGDPIISEVYKGVTIDATTGEVVEQAFGSGSMTYTTPATMYLPDYEGNPVAITQNTAPWYGARWVDNLCLATEDLTNAAWTDLLTTTTATTLEATTANATCLQTVTASESTFVFSAYITRVTGTGFIDLTLDGGTTWIEVYPDTTQGRFYIQGTNVTNPEFGVRIQTLGDKIEFTKCQLEDTVLRADTKTPGEYVTSRGIYANAISNVTVTTRSSDTLPPDPEVPPDPDYPPVPIGDAVLQAVSDVETAGAQGFFNNSATFTDGWLDQSTSTFRPGVTFVTGAESYNGTYSCKMYLQKSDFVPDVSGKRARVQLVKNNVDVPFEQEQEYWVGWAAKFGTEFGANPKVDAAAGIVIFQLHGTGGSTNYSQPFDLAFRTRGGGLPWEFVCTARVGQAGTNTFTGQPPIATISDLSTIADDQWHRIVIRIKPSLGNTGIVQLWIDDILIGERINGPNTYWGGDGQPPDVTDSVFAVLDIYHPTYNYVPSRDDTPSYTCYYDEFRIAKGSGGYVLVDPGTYL